MYHIQIHTITGEVHTGADPIPDGDVGAAAEVSAQGICQDAGPLTLQTANGWVIIPSQQIASIRLVRVEGDQ